MIKQKWFMLLLFLFFCSCNKTESPKYLDANTMGRIIMETKKAEAMSYSDNEDKEQAEKQLSKYKTDILKKHNTTKERFDSSLAYYLSSPELTDLLLESIKRNIH